MAWFVRRPLTCLFWIAALCGGVVGLRDHPQSDWFVALLFGQLYIVAAWAAVGGAHRLARGGVLVAVPLVPAAIALWAGDSSDEPQQTLAFAMIVTGITFAATWSLATILGVIGARRHEGIGPRWQISVTEILGWTIVAAIASWAASMARIPKLEHVYGLWTTMLTPIPPAVMAAVFLGVRPRCDRVGLVAVIVVLAAFFVFASQWDEQRGDDLAMYAFMFALVGLWTLVMRLDENAAERAAISKWWPRRKSGEPS